MLDGIAAIGQENPIALWGAATGSISLVLAIISASIAFCSFKLSRRNAERQVRAWVCYEELGVEKVLLQDGAEGIAFRVRWKNCGATPALGIVVTMQGEACRNQAEAERFVFPPVTIDRDLKGVIGPGITMDSPTATFESSAYRSGSTVFRSTIRYYDVASDVQRLSSVRLLVRSHHNGGGGTTFVHQMLESEAF